MSDPADNSQRPPLLSVRGLTVATSSSPDAAVILDRVDFDVGEGEVLGVVGESGSGKSMTALAIMRLLAAPLCVTGGTIEFAGENLLAKSEDQMCALRGAHISMIFQEPMTSLNPVMSVGAQIVETLRQHQNLTQRDARKRAQDLLRLVEIPSAERRIDDYPHQMSGGMRQRVMIAMALACRPRLLIADEPTTALDVTVQAQILDLLRHLQREFGAAVMIITHDLGVVAEFADRVSVMYAGRIVETAPTAAVFDRPAHPYTRGLLNSMPPIDIRVERLQPIPGTVPSVGHMPTGCRFHPRCDLAVAECRTGVPSMRSAGPRHAAACLRLDTGVNG